MIGALNKFDAAATKLAAEYSERWRRDVKLLATIAPVPAYRWPLAEQIGVTIADFTWDETQLIARALHVGHTYGREICAKLAARLLSESSLTWDATDTHPFVSCTRWSPNSLAALFTRKINSPDEAELIVAAFADLLATKPLPSSLRPEAA
jgi:hypothetical protein